jgi:hypothetical protein
VIELIPVEKYNQLISCMEAGYRVFLKRELRRAGVCFHLRETTDSLMQKRFSL